MGKKINAFLTEVFMEQHRKANFGKDKLMATAEEIEARYVEYLSCITHVLHVITGFNMTFFVQNKIHKCRCLYEYASWPSTLKINIRTPFFPLMLSLQLTAESEADEAVDYKMMFMTVCANVCDYFL